MKKIILFAAFGVFALSSCKKDWTCVCQNYGEVESYTIYNASKKNAKNQCQGKVGFGAPGLNVNTNENCSIK